MKQITCPHCADTYPDFDVAHVCSKGPYAPKLKPRMNKRIQELVEQAGGHFGEGLEFAVVFGELEDFEKFAELIVQKCADIGEQYADGNYEVRNQILEHFGVEE
jgi:hypothetical protein